MQRSTTQAAKRAHSDIFQTGFELLKAGLKNSSFVFIEHVLTEKTDNEALYDLLDRSIEPPTQSLVIMDVFTCRALTSSRFACPAPKLIQDNHEEQSKVLDRARDPPDFFFLVLQAESSSSQYSGGDKYRKQAKNKHINSIGAESDFTPIKLNEMSDCKN